MKGNKDRNTFIMGGVAAIYGVAFDWDVSLKQIPNWRELVSEKEEQFREAFPNEFLDYHAVWEAVLRDVLGKEIEALKECIKDAFSLSSTAEVDFSVTGWLTREDIVVVTFYIIVDELAVRSVISKQGITKNGEEREEDVIGSQLSCRMLEGKELILPFVAWPLYEFAAPVINLQKKGRKEGLL